ncbi:hypothetical protein ACLQ2R_26890 [Streptosporangium sp. DT93]
MRATGARRGEGSPWGRRRSRMLDVSRSLVAGLTMAALTGTAG